jgi:hypothetical protein
MNPIPPSVIPSRVIVAPPSGTATGASVTITAPEDLSLRIGPEVPFRYEIVPIPARSIAIWSSTPGEGFSKLKLRMLRVRSKRNAVEEAPTPNVGMFDEPE